MWHAFWFLFFCFVLALCIWEIITFHFVCFFSSPLSIHIILSLYRQWFRTWFSLPCIRILNKDVLICSNRYKTVRTARAALNDMQFMCTVRVCVEETRSLHNPIYILEPGIYYSFYIYRINIRDVHFWNCFVQFLLYVNLIRKLPV